LGANQAGAATGQGSAEIKEVKSSILEFLLDDGPDGRVVRSGILADIRMNPDLRTNSIVVTAPEESMNLVAALIQRLDRPAAQAADIKVFKLDNSDATAMQTLLERLFGIQRTGQQAGAQGQQAGPPGLLLAGAEDSSSMLIPLRFSVDVRTNSIIAIGGAEALRVVEAVLLRLDESDIRQRQNEVYRLKNSPATSVATAISQFLQTQRQVEQADPGLVSPFEQIEREVIVVAETTSNSLLISATPRYFKEIKSLVVQLDKSPKQVLIQALIVEVQLNNVDEFGVEFGLQDSILFNRSIVPAPTTITNTTTAVSGQQTTTQQIISESATPGYLFAGQALGNNTSAGINQKSVAAQGNSLFNTGLTNSTLGYGGLVLQAASENVNFLLRALAARTRVDILSRPQIRTVDNQIAQIQVGQEIPRINGFTPSGTAGVITPQFQQRAIGIILQVTPRISPDGLVVMEVVARKDSLSPNSVSLGTNVNGTAITSPIVNTTNAITTIGVNSGQTVILGGMITKNDTVTERKVPVLGDIPIVGRAFRYDLKSMDRTELLIFLTPRIIRDDEEAEMFKQIEVERLNFIESEVERINGPIYGLPGPFDPSGSSGAPSAPPASTGPKMPAQPLPAPPDPGIEPPATSGRNREQQLLPGSIEEVEGRAAMLQDDNEDLDAGFVQTSYRVPQKADRSTQRTGFFRSAVKSPAPAKSGKPFSKESTRQRKQQGDDQ
jgi:type II secretion system protein D